jgi:23S rRNA pseudouridine1911/1915/1917 synthase
MLSWKNSILQAELMDKEPYVLDETDDFAVLFKPPKMHSVPLAKKSGDTLLDWYAHIFPGAVDLLHRLDFETHGLALAAKNLKAYEFLKAAQDRDEFIKEYSAVCINSARVSSIPASGFPPPPFSTDEFSSEKPLVIESYFRPFGPGRKQVRPVIEDGKKHRELAKDRGGFYRTGIIAKTGDVFTVRIKRGFRHQIRCHLCWIGCPILNDPLYRFQLNEEAVSDNEPAAGILALRAHALFFPDPSSGKPREYRIAPLEK